MLTLVMLALLAGVTAGKVALNVGYDPYDAGWCHGAASMLVVMTAEHGWRWLRRQGS